MPKLTLKSWRAPAFFGRPTPEQKRLTELAYGIMNSVNSPIWKARALNDLAVTRGCDKCIETQQLRQLAYLYSTMAEKRLEIMQKALAERQNLNKILEAAQSARFSFYKTFVWATDTRLQKSASDGFYYLHGYVSDGSVDRDGDRMTASALKDMRDSLPGLSLFGDHEHGWKDTLGVFTKSEIDGRGLWAEVRLEDPEKNPLVASLLHKLETGERLGLSIGGDMNGHEYVKEADETGRQRKVRNILGVKLYETSVVGLPANANALVTDITYR